MSDIALDRHALLSDCGAAALVTDTGSVDWLCLPAFDSPPVFARLLDPDAGHFLIAPDDPDATSTSCYRPHGLVLGTTWTTPHGSLEVTDALALGPGVGHALGRAAPGVLLRWVRCTAGAVRTRVSYAPRPEFGLVHPLLVATDGAVVSRGGPTVLVLSTTVELDLDGATAEAVLALREGDEVGFALTPAGSFEPEPRPWTAGQIESALAETENGWRGWSELHQGYEGPHRDLVHHSGVVLQGLTNVHTGAMVAAPTTSLPEGIGSGRTWDYRYTWVRDASMVMQGFSIAACPEEAGRFFSFLATAAGTQLDRGLDLQVMFGIGAERDLSEHELSHLRGWRGSGPVRVGNGAWDQRQLDVYGSLLDAAHTLRDQLGELEPPTRRLLVAAVDAAALRWGDDDQGIWELRGPARPFLHSKLMCWVALDRGVAMADQLQVGGRRRAEWAAARDQVRDAILDRGWSERAGAYTQCLDSDELDASVLLLATTGFLPGDDTRLLATIDAIDRELTDPQGLVYRYRGADGLAGEEGAFLLCTGWLAHALACTDQVRRARTVLDRLVRCASPLGLFSEQVGAGTLLGNYPQAFSHLGLIIAAQALADAERRTAPPA